MVRETMREVARSIDAYSDGKKLLRASIAKVEQNILEEPRASVTEEELAGSLKTAAKLLERTARELSSLSTRLSESRRQRRVRERVTYSPDFGGGTEIHQIGLEGIPTALLARPSGRQSLKCDLTTLSETLGCEVEGDAFPYEIVLDEHLFVLDDDGSVFVLVEGLPEREVEVVTRLLQRIAGQLYP
ncbi:hypothetical protein [Maioricimonas rarisocia]|uniref:hypothetical protein n=1 Tax=Maioricimonas rarisocia TaxID=2528026 RepID=UPI0018D216AF|nr:hypothetical protein [Maioricimonas rarisocia]